MNKLVSVIIPAYNAEKFISDTIQSVINQSYTNWEIIVVNDGSTDQTLAAVEKFTANPRIKCITQQNAGVSAARNHGFKVSSGEYIGFLDADDIWHPDFLSRRVEVMEKDPEAGVVSSYGYAIDETSRPLHIFFKGQDKQVVKRILEFHSDYTTFPSNLLSRRSVVEKIGGFNLQLSNAADKMFLLEAGFISKITCLEEQLVYYRIHSRSMHRNLDLMIRDYITFFRIADEKKIYDSAAHRNECWAKMYKVCAGECIAQGKNLKGIQLLLRSFFLSPQYLVKESLRIMSFRKNFFRLLYASGIGIVFNHINNRLKTVPILLFHKVDLEQDKYWPSHHPIDFLNIITFLQKHYELIGLNDLLTRSPKELKNCAAIVFDDAFHDFYEYAFPILKDLKVPSTMFVPVDCVDKHRAIWSAQLNSAFKHTSVKQLDLTIGKRSHHFDLSSEQKKIKASHFIQGVLKHVSTEEEVAVRERVKELLSYSPSGPPKIMSWETIRQLNGSVDFQSHSMTHTYLTNIGKEEGLQYEIADSKNVLQDRIQKSVTFFAYPIGEYTDRIIKITQKYYSAAFATGNRRVKLKKLNDERYRYRIPRFNISDTSPHELFFRINGFHLIFKK